MNKSLRRSQQSACCGAESGAASSKRTTAADSRRTNEENAASANFETKSSLEHARASNGSFCAEFRKRHCVGGANYSGAKRNSNESNQNRASAARHATASSER